MKYLFKNIELIYRYKHALILEHIEKYDLKSSELPVLMTVAENDGMCQEEIVYVLKVDKSKIARTVKNLCDKGFLERKKNKEDKRYYSIYLTLKAYEIKPLLKKEMKIINNQILKDFSDEELKLLIKMLDKLKGNMLEKITKK